MADLPELPTWPAQEQLNLLGLPVSEPDNAAGPHSDHASCPDENGQRNFVPSNRERIMQQLGALILSPDFPPGAGTPADVAQAPLLVHDGLRSEEIDILADGRPQRFPVLAEIRSEACRSGTAAFGILDVVALYFRNEEEASDFRFRPVDELDTEHLSCIADSSLFALDGASRFSVAGHVTSSEIERRAVLADRIAGGISCLLELATVDEVCRQEVADLLSRQGAVPWMECLSRFFTSEAESGASSAHAAIVRAFVEHESGSPSRLVEEIGRCLGEVADPDVVRALPAWLNRADAVLSNRIVLDGKVLSDNGTIALRAAILAVVVDDVQDLAAFLQAQRPAGRQVVVAAAFLIGLRTGVSNLSWDRKRRYLDFLSPLVVGLHRPDRETRDEVLAAFQVEPDETVSPLELILFWRELQLVRWTPQQDPDGTALITMAPPMTVDDNVQPDQEPPVVPTNAARDDSIQGPDGRVIEIMKGAIADDATTLRLALAESDRLRKPKEILEAACTPGIGWRVGITADGAGALYAEVRDGPVAISMQEMIRKIPVALSLYLLPVKSKRSSRTTKGKAAGKSLT